MNSGGKADTAPQMSPTGVLPGDQAPTGRADRTEDVMSRTLRDVPLSPPGDVTVIGAVIQTPRALDVLVHGKSRGDQLHRAGQGRSAHDFGAF